MFYDNNISSENDYIQYDRNGKEIQLQYRPDKMDCSLALKYYLKAREVSKKPEFQAMCTFMAAKCEQGMDSVYIINENGNFIKDAAFDKYFHELHDRYANTKYEKELLNECSYFAFFMREEKRRK